MNETELYLIGSTAFIALGGLILMGVGEWLYRSLLREEREQAQRQREIDDRRLDEEVKVIRGDPS